MQELFPMIQPEISEPKVDELPLYKEVAWNFDKGKPIFKNGNPVIVEGNEAIKVWAWKALMTERARYEIYSWNFGSEVETLIGSNFTEGLKKAEAARYVREAIEINPYIISVPRVEVTFNAGVLHIFAIIQTVYGEVDIYV